ncbi:hypothetical protein [Solimonas marina]|uniref:Neutral zinc metallopeptidase n=1 Tax=Solimonas marina TaxID=2714601 RepID=A0A970B561_9GAMM|nr:hypothetical protein [Solimonas marina]NKF23062.1 hypothetical protein [Solimonas marina]
MFKAIILSCCAITLSQQAIAQCVPVTHALDDQQALNQFWGTSVPMCQAPGSNGAFANRSAGVVLVDQNWLDYMANTFGPWAASGIVAHEWGHMIQGNVSGTAAELQADCLAGVFLRGAGVSWVAAEQFARSNWFAGDAEWSFGGHGLPAQRANAAHRGYYGFSGQPPYLLAALCPLSAF